MPEIRNTQTFGDVVRKLFRILRAVSLVMIALAVWVLVRETYALGAWFGGLHWSLGALFVGALAFAVWKFAVVPARAYWAMPEAVTPPPAPEADAAMTPKALAARARFLVGVADALAANPRLGDRAAEIAVVRTEAAALAARPLTTSASEFESELRAFEARRLNPLFSKLDEDANQVIRAEAMAVGLGTAISMNGALDAWIVLWRNMNLVAKVAQVYYGRPGIRGTLFVMRDVATGVFVASQAQGLANGAAGLFGGFLGKAGSVLMGPVMDGAINAIVTVRIGYVAKRRCRAFRKWTDATALVAVTGCLAEAGAQAKAVALDVVRVAGGGLVAVAGDAVGKAKDFVLGLFQKDEASPPAAPRAAH